MNNLSQYNGIIPSPENPERKITSTPLYDKNQVLALLDAKGTSSFTAWTKGCKDDLLKWELDHDNVLELIKLCLRGGMFLGAEWCQQKPNGPWAACDAYRVFRNEWVKHADKDMTFEYYIKFAISKTGQILLLASCHPSENM